MTRLPELTRLILEDGSLTGRSADHERGVRDSDAGLRALTVAGRCLTAGDPTGDQVIALTFDDGPNPPYPGRILDVLERYGVPATFFCVGLHASAHTEELARMAVAGHGFGKHTRSHPFPPRSAPACARGATGAHRRGHRERRRHFHAADVPAPYGSRSPEVVSWLAGQEDGPTVVLGDVDAGDWAMPGADAMATTVLQQATRLDRAPARRRR